MNHAGEITRATSVARPTVAVITNVGTQPISVFSAAEKTLHAPRQRLSLACARIWLTSSLRLFRLAGDYTKFIAEFARPAHVVCKTVGATEADAQQVTLDEEGLPPTATISAASGWSRMVTPVPGRAVVDDLLLALEAIETLILT